MLLKDLQKGIFPECMQNRRDILAEFNCDQFLCKFESNSVSTVDVFTQTLNSRYSPSFLNSSIVPSYSLVLSPNTMKDLRESGASLQFPF